MLENQTPINITRSSENEPIPPAELHTTPSNPEKDTPINNIRTESSEDELTIIPPVDLPETPSNLAATTSAPNSSPELPTTPSNSAPSTSAPNHSAELPTTPSNLAPNSSPELPKTPSYSAPSTSAPNPSPQLPTTPSNLAPTPQTSPTFKNEIPPVNKSPRSPTKEFPEDDGFSDLSAFLSDDEIALDKVYF